MLRPGGGGPEYIAYTEGATAYTSPKNGAWR